MQKSDLKSGMSVKLRNGEKGLIVDVNNIKIIQYVDDWDNLNASYTTDLKYSSNSNLAGYDIMEVYRILNYDCVIRENLCKPENLIWKRKEVTELTMQEIADKFGVDVNNIKVKK